jgi:hypothetical protein
MKTNKVIKVRFLKEDMLKAQPSILQDFVLWTQTGGYEGDSILDRDRYSSAHRMLLYRAFLTTLGLCSYYGEHRRSHKNDPKYHTYYTRDIKKISLFRLKYSV